MLNTAERECLVRVNEGKASKDIARELGLSPNYVDTCLKQAAVKLNVKGRYLAAKLLADAGSSPQEDTVTSTPTNLVLQTAGLSLNSGSGDKAASAGAGNDPGELGPRRHHETESCCSRGGGALPKIGRQSARARVWHDV